MVPALLFAILGLAAPPLAVGIRTGGHQPGSPTYPQARSWLSTHGMLHRLGITWCLPGNRRGSLTKFICTMTTMPCTWSPPWTDPAATYLPFWTALVACFAAGFAHLPASWGVPTIPDLPLRVLSG